MSASVARSLATVSGLAATNPGVNQRSMLACATAPVPCSRTSFARAGQSCSSASIERWFTPGFVAANPDTVARLRATLADTPPEGYAGCCDAIAGMDLLDAIESVAAPTLVIAGRQDPATPPPHPERIAERIPGARLELVDAAHLANIELADDVTALTLAHLEGR